MTREEQDRLWAELPEGEKRARRKVYNELLELNSNSESRKYHFALYDLEVLYGKHNLHPALNYEDVAREVFKSGYCYYDNVYDEMACTSIKQVKKICAINKLLNVAKYLNKNEDGSDWVPDWGNKKENKYYIYIGEGGKIHISSLRQDNLCLVYFRTIEIARQAVQILGANVIRTALTTKY